MMVEPTLTLAEAARWPWEVVVVGAGPAGALAARELARLGRAVLLVDRATFPRWKVCGCCLNARALATLAAVGLGDLPARHAAVPLRSVLVAARGCQARLRLPGGVALSREAFDAALVRAAIAAGAAFLPQTCAALGPAAPSGREASLTGGGTTASALAALVLAADGLGGRLLAGAAASPPTASSRIGAGTVTDDGPDFFGPGCVHMACGTGGYVGLVRLEDGRLDVAAAFDRDAVRRAGGPGAAAARILREAGMPEVPGLPERPWRGTPPLTRTAERLAWERVLVLGDAAGYVEPFTGEGMAWALAAAAAVAPLADRAARRWDPSVGRRWAALHRRVVAGRQTTCRLAAAVLRHPHLTRAAVRVLGRLPGLAAPVIDRLNAAPAFPKGALP